MWHQVYLIPDNLHLQKFSADTYAVDILHTHTQTNLVADVIISRFTVVQTQILALNIHFTCIGDVYMLNAYDNGSGPSNYSAQHKWTFIIPPQRS